MAIAQICVLLLVAAALSVEAAFTQTGKCPDYHFTSGLDSSKLAGDWYIVKTASNGFNLGDKVCEVKKLIATANDGLEATVTLVSGDKAVLKADKDASQAGKFEIKMGDKPSVHLSFIDSDSTNYAVVLLCTSDGEKHGHYIELVSRKRTLEPSFVEKGKAALAAAKLTDTLVDNTEAAC